MARTRISQFSSRTTRFALSTLSRADSHACFRRENDRPRCKVILHCNGRFTATGAHQGGQRADDPLGKKFHFSLPARIFYSSDIATRAAPSKRALDPAFPDGCHQIRGRSGLFCTPRYRSDDEDGSFDQMEMSSFLFRGLIADSLLGTKCVQ